MVRVPYEKLPGLEHVYLEDSFVLACIERESEIVFSLDLVLTPGHESYTPAEPNEQHCYRPGKLIFRNPTAVTWLRKDFSDPSFDASGQFDFGAIDSMTLEDGVYRLVGSWGAVTIKSDPPTILLASP
ncbi:MAG TPA: hypothetical protein VGR70_10380 [Stellaceae bacterium]|nr:hypothetical protein [Stellaceae bacterium]